MENQDKNEGPPGILFFSENRPEKQSYKILNINNSNIYLDAIISIIYIATSIYCLYILIKYA